MANLYGWVGKILRVDLTTGVTSDVLTSDYVPKYIGGAGVGARIALDEIPPKTKAFDADNRLIFMTGPMAGTLVPSAGRVHVGCVSPITYPTEDYVQSTFGGYWGTDLKFAGYDGIIVQGKATKPVWLWINDGKVEIRDAAGYWGKGFYSVQEAIWKDLGSNRIRVAAIGPAGENLVRFAFIGTHGGARVTGVGGMGAVMGSKKLKAIAVMGTGGVQVAKPDELASYAYTVGRLVYRPETRPPWGFEHQSEHRSWCTATFQDCIKATACYGCRVACQYTYAVPDAIRPSHSSKCTAKSWYMSYDLKKHGSYTSAYTKVQALLDELGLSQNEIPQIISWLQGCYTKGVLKPTDTGIPLDDIGEYSWAENLANIITFRQGFGDKLAEGIVRADAALGGIGKEFTANVNRGFNAAYQPEMHPVCGLEAAMMSSRQQWLFHYFGRYIVYHNQGSDGKAGSVTPQEWFNVLKDVLGRTDVLNHIDDAYYEPNKAWLAKYLGDYSEAVLNSMMLCERSYPMYWSWYSDKPNRKGFSPEGEAKLFSLTTGVEMDISAVAKVGERNRNVRRAIDVLGGRRRVDDTLSDQTFNTPLKNWAVPGPDGVFVKQTRQLDRVKFEKLKDAYYTERGWNLTTGIPTRAKLESLDLKDVADKLGV